MPVANDRESREHEGRGHDRVYFEALLASAPNAIAVLDGDGRIESVNPAFERMFEYDRNEVVGRDLDKLVSPEDDRAHAQALTERLRAGETVAEEGRRRKKSGTLFPVQVSGGPPHQDE